MTYMTIRDTNSSQPVLTVLLQLVLLSMCLQQSRNDCTLPKGIDTLAKF